MCNQQSRKARNEGNAQKFLRTSHRTQMFGKRETRISLGEISIILQVNKQ